MRISVQWLSELINLKNVNLDYLVEKLTLGGFEVEETFETITNNQRDIILDITSTANRSDSLSLKGIAKEVAALLDTEYNIIPYTTSFLNSEQKVKRLLETTSAIQLTEKNCSDFFTVAIENVTNHNSPKWLKQKLISAEIDPLNNLLDFKNYITLETGYPFEFYDLEKIRSKLATHKFPLSLGSRKNDSFLAEDNLTYNLTSDILTVKSEKEILSIAGIIPNKEFIYTRETHLVLIEASIFNSKKIRQTSRALGLRTERSARYEKGLNSNKLIESLWRLLYLLKILNNNISYKFYSAAKTKEPKKQIIELSYQTIIQTLGPINCFKNRANRNLKPEEISIYLNRLGFEFNFNKNSKMWTVSIPIERNDDITRPIDIVEEIGRLHGFNNFVTFLPEISKIGNEDLSYQIRKKLTTCLLSEGFTEVINYSLVNEQNSKTIKIINPLIKDYANLRSSLLPNLIETLSDNLKQGNLGLEAFEYGHTFFPSKKSFANEIEQVAGIFGGIEVKNSWSTNPDTLSWFKAKGKIENIFAKLNLWNYWQNDTVKKYKNIFHPYRSSSLYLAPGIYLGTFGQIHPILANKFNISSKLYLFEFNFEAFKNEFKYQKLPIYNDYSTYPKIVKDLSFIVDQKIPYEHIQTILSNIGTPFLTSNQLLDEYTGKGIPQTKKSLCIQLTFQAKNRTLLSKEIDKIVENTKIILIDQFKIIIRT